MNEELKLKDEDSESGVGLSRVHSYAEPISPTPLHHQNGHSPPNNQNINDLLNNLKLAQVNYFDGQSSSIATSSTTPSPTPIGSLVGLDDCNLILNDTAINNLSQLARISEVQNGSLMPVQSSPLVSVQNGSAMPVTVPTSTALTPAVNSGSRFHISGAKPSVMQIRNKFGQLGQAKGHFHSPHGFCLGIDEEIVIADTNNHRICIFDKNGEFKHSFGVAGKEEAQLWYPRKVIEIR